MSRRYIIELKPTAHRDLRKLPVATQRCIAQKLQFYLEQSDPLQFARSLVGVNRIGQYRFRIGDYRIIFDVIGRTIYILMIEHRREIYRRK